MPITFVAGEAIDSSLITFQINGGAYVPTGVHSYDPPTSKWDVQKKSEFGQTGPTRRTRGKWTGDGLKLGLFIDAADDFEAYLTRIGGPLLPNGVSTIEFQMQAIYTPLGGGRPHSDIYSRVRIIEIAGDNLDGDGGDPAWKEYTLDIMNRATGYLGSEIANWILQQ